MAQRTPKIVDDIKPPEKVTPPATSRHILNQNGSSAPSDPMMVSGGGDESQQTENVPMAHSVKSIVPIHPDLKPDEEAAPEAAVETETPETDEPTEKVITIDPKPEAKTETEAEAPAAEAEAKAEAPAEPATDEKKPAVEAPAAEEASDDDKRDPEAAQSAEDAAKDEAEQKREVEIEALIASGKYAVPINAVQRHRSRMNTIVLCILAVLLLVILLDAVADVGIIKAPSSIPHTHLFSR